MSRHKAFERMSLIFPLLCKGLDRHIKYKVTNLALIALYMTENLLPVLFSEAQQPTSLVFEQNVYAHCAQSVVIR
jgi:hypothetical protein